MPPLNARLGRTATRQKPTQHQPYCRSNEGDGASDGEMTRVQSASHTCSSAEKNGKEATTLRGSIASSSFARKAVSFLALPLRAKQRVRSCCSLMLVQHYRVVLI